MAKQEVPAVAPTEGTPASRPHTGSKRNEVARQAILRAAMTLFIDQDVPAVTIDAIATRAGVGKQTIYRWWPNRAAVVTEALTESARDRIPDVDTGTLRGDLEHFLIKTFRTASSRPVARALKMMMADAQNDPRAAEVLHDFTRQRRAALDEVLRKGLARGDLDPGADISLAVDQAFGFLWYRLLVEHASLTRTSAIALAAALARQLQR